MNRQQVLDCYYAPTTVPPLSLSSSSNALIPSLFLSLSLHTHTLEHAFISTALSLSLSNRHSSHSLSLFNGEFCLVSSRCPSSALLLYEYFLPLGKEFSIFSFSLFPNLQSLSI